MKRPGVILQKILQYLLVHCSFTMNVNAWLALHFSYRAIINHFTPKIDSWAAVNHLTSMTSEQVCTLLRDQSFYRLGVGGFKGVHLVFRGEWRGNQSSSTEYERGTIENSQPVNCLWGGGGGEAWEYYINLTRHTTYNQNPATLLPQTIIGPFVELLAFDGKSFGLKWWAYY